MVVSNDDILRPSLHAVTKQSDLDFFVPALNNAFGDDVMWLPNEYDWVEADNSISVMAGGSAAAGVLSGTKSVAYLSGLDKTIVVTSSELLLTAKSGDVTIVYDEELTTHLHVDAESSTAQFVNMSTNSFDVSKFYLEDQSLVYRTGSSNIVFDLRDESVISLQSISDPAPIELSFINGSYQIVQGLSSPIVFTDPNAAFHNTNEKESLWADNVMPEMDQISNSDNAEIDINIIDTFSEHATLTQDSQNAVLTFEDILVPEDTTPILTNQNELLLTEDILAPEDISFLPNIENMQDPLATKSSDQELTHLVSNNIYRSLNELLSSVDDDLIFTQESKSDLYEAYMLKQLENHNDQILQKSLHIDTFSDLVFENPFDFYDEI